jgi:hypothetical protein
MKNNKLNSVLETVLLSIVVTIAIFCFALIVGVTEYYFIIVPKKKELEDQIKLNRPKPKKTKSQAPAPWQIYTPEEIINNK